jgi:homeobox protein cut-like
VLAYYHPIQFTYPSSQYVEFAGIDADDSISLPNPNAAKSTSSNASLETLLATKNRKLLEELTRFRVLHSELEESFRGVSEELAGVRNELEKQKVLTDRLENDLMNLGGGQQQHPNGNAEKASGMSTPSQSTDGLSGLNLGSTSVRDFWSYYANDVDIFLRIAQFDTLLFHFPPRPTLQSFQLSLLNEIASASGMPN